MARERNRVVVAGVAVLIVALAVYGPMALLTPLPATQPTLLSVQPAGGDGPDPALPAGGSSAVTLDAEDVPIAAGDAQPRPMAAIAKVITALLVLEKYPLEEGRSGSSITVTRSDYDAYARYAEQGVRAVRVTEGDSWTQREALLAMLIASSNNHAELLARWAFGSVDEYVRAANAWLDERGFAGTTVADATGLSPESTGTAADLARLAALASADPFFAEAVSLDAVTTVRGVAFDNTIRYRPGDGVLGLSRSYTDVAGVSLLFSVQPDVNGTGIPVFGAILGASSYDQLSDDMDALLASLPDALRSGETLPAGTAVARYDTPWGQSVDAVTGRAIVGTGWASAATELPPADVREVVTAGSGVKVGALSAPDGGVAVLLEDSVRDPGPLWRLSSPAVVLAQFWALVTGRSGG